MFAHLCDKRSVATVNVVNAALVVAVNDLRALDENVDQDQDRETMLAQRYRNVDQLRLSEMGKKKGNDQKRLWNTLTLLFS